MEQKVGIMTEKTHKVSFSKIIQSGNYSAFILQANKKQFAIYTLPSTGIQIEDILGNKNKRPQTHQLIDTILSGLDVSINKVVLSEVRENVYCSKLILSKKNEDIEDILEIDARPSDSLLLALKHDIDVLCTQQVLDASPSFVE